MQLKIYVPKHPLIEHLTNLMQSIDMPRALVRNSATEIAYWLSYEAMRGWISLIEVNSKRVDGTLVTDVIDPEENVLVLPLIKSGLLMCESIHRLPANIQFFYVNFCNRNSDNLREVISEDKSAFINVSHSSKFLIVDSIVLSSDRVLSLLSLMVAQKIDLASVRIIFILCTSDVLQDIGRMYPNLTIYTSCIKDISNESDLLPYQELLEHLQT